MYAIKHVLKYSEMYFGILSFYVQEALYLKWGKH